MDKWKSVHTAMLNDIEKCWSIELSEAKQVERAFNIALDHYVDVQKDLQSHIFKNKAEEIDFYKNIKPSFTSYIDYFTILYLELNYMPDGDNDKHIYFWTEESKKLQKFLERYSYFSAYYRSQETSHDEQYFLPENYKPEPGTATKIYDIDSPFISAMDTLISALLAQEMYHDYVQRKLRSIRNSIQ